MQKLDGLVSKIWITGRYDYSLMTTANPIEWDMNSTLI